MYQSAHVMEASAAAAAAQAAAAVTAAETNGNSKKDEVPDVIADEMIKSDGVAEKSVMGKWIVYILFFLIWLWKYFCVFYFICSCQ